MHITRNALVLLTACALVIGGGAVWAGSEDLSKTFLVDAIPVSKESRTMILTFGPESRGGWGSNLEDPSSVRLTLEGARALCAPSDGLRVFVNLPGATKDTPLDNPHYVTSVAFFPGNSGSCDDSQKSTFNISLGRTFEELAVRGLIDDTSDVTITVVPIVREEAGASPLVKIDRAKLTYKD